MHGSEKWEINAGLKKKVETFEMSHLKSIRGVTVRDRMGNEDLERDVV